MGYIGRNLANLSDRVVLDDITTSANATFNLLLNGVAFVPSSSESLTVSLNGVIQKCGGTNPSYTVSGSQITFASSLSASDSIDFIIAERGITLQTPSAGSVGTSQLASTAVTTAKIADDAVTKDKVSNLMYPAFEAQRTTDQNVTDVTLTKVQFDTEVLDTDNCYDNTTNYRFTPTVAGKYFVYGCINNDSQGNSQLGYGQTYIYKNGSSYRKTETYFSSSNVRRSSIFTTAIIDMNGTTDYLELYGNANDTSGTPLFRGANNESFFGAYRIG